MTLPNFLIIGANRAGTTSLYSYLAQHPEIYMSPLKEPMFFTLEGARRDPTRPDARSINLGIDNLKDYEALFRGVTSERAIGEASTAYLPNPHAPARIRHYIPDARFIAVLRQPVDRAVSAHAMYVRKGFEPITDFAQAIEAEQKPGDWRHYLQLGFYYAQVKRYVETFDAQQLRIYLYDDFGAKPLDVIQSVFQFLGVDDSFVPDVSVRHNASSSSFAPTAPTSFRSKLKRFISRRLPFRGALEQPAPPPAHSQLSPQLREQLCALYRADILKLEELIQRDLSRWLSFVILMLVAEGILPGIGVSLGFSSGFHFSLRLSF